MSENKNSNFSRLVGSIKRHRQNKLSKNIPNRPNGDQYYYIHEFEQASEKMCVDFDKKNEIIFQKNLKLYNDINKKLANTPFNIDNKPLPPKRPTNYERLHLWKKRNVKVSAHNQTIAILYLLANNINIKLSDSDNGVEPFEAVNIAEKISLDKNENMINKIKTILPSLNLVNDTFNKYNTQKGYYNKEYPLNTINNMVNNLSVSEPNLSEMQMSYDIHQNINTGRSTDNISNNRLCSNPEHHTVNDKINYYNSNDQRNSHYPDLPDPEGYGFLSLQNNRNSVISHQVLSNRMSTNIIQSTPQPSAPSAPSAPQPSPFVSPGVFIPPEDLKDTDNSQNNDGNISKPPSYRTESDTSN